MISRRMKPSTMAPLAIALVVALSALACGGDDGVTPMCPTAEDCKTQPGPPPSRSDADAAAPEDEADAADDESPEE